MKRNPYSILVLLLVLIPNGKTLAQSCQAGFDVIIDPNTSTIFLTDLSTSDTTITSWFWDFGDGSTSNDQNPVHTYAQNGNYTVCLTIHDNNNCESTTCSFIHVDFLPGECNAAYDFEQTPGTLEINFTDSSTSNNNIIAWSWAFGDGGSSAEQNPVHIYGTEDDYEVCLMIGDAQGCEDTICLTITVDPILQSCLAAFNVVIDPDTSTIFLTDQSISDTTITSWFWDFGDGNTSNEQNPVHTYSHDSTYTVCLTIHDDHNCMSTACSLITIDLPSGIESFQNRKQLFIYPNPFNTYTTIQYELYRNADVSIEIYNMSGYRIGTIIRKNELAGMHTHNINRDDLTPGNYIIKMVVNGDVLATRITVVR